MRQSVLPFPQTRHRCMALKFETGFDPLYGQGVSVAPDVQR
ncbi:MBL fold metallo-hydrolase, partial [Mesorhizobium sp. M7A.F.Ca.CA.002.09.1.1]